MPQAATPPEPLSADVAARLAEFARMVKAAARAVSLYPPTHPSIQASLSRVLAAAQRLTAGGDITLTRLIDQGFGDGGVGHGPA